MKTKNRSVGLKIENALYEKIQLKINHMGFKGTSEFIRYAINKALAEDERHQILVNKFDEFANKSMKFYSDKSNINFEVSKKIYEKNVQVESLMSQVLNTLKALSDA